jgi:DNA-binding IclR family transcriptional regulator
MVTVPLPAQPNDGLSKSGGSMLTRGLALLAAYRTGEVELSQTELARRTNLPKPTVHRLVAELVEWQALERTKAGVRLGPWLYLLGENVPRISMLRSASQPYLDRLHELTGEFACLSVLGRGGVLDVAWAGLAPWRYAPQEAPRGTTSVAASKALLAGGSGPRPAVVHGLARHVAPLSQRVPTLGANRFRLASVAMVVCVSDGVVGAVSVVGRADRFDAKNTETHVRATATAVGRRLALNSVFDE